MADSSTSASAIATKLSLVYLICCLPLVFVHTLGLAAAATPNKLYPDEVRALREIAKRMGKTDWDFGVDPCSGQGNWSVPFRNKGFESNVTCDCNLYNSTACHVVRIGLKAQNISGAVPPEFSELRHLQILDLSRNYFNGSIPPQWATMRLVELSFMGNWLSGPFPQVLTEITTLTTLIIEGNRFSGPVPPQIGKLVNIQKLSLSSNSFMGELPVTLAKLISLTDMRISDNNFTGKIPDFIGNWTKIEKLHIQGCPFDGPIPSSISALTSLRDLRISDLNGEESSFPPLRDMKSMETLILRKCSISGEIPGYVGDLIELKYIDLSFNSFSGEIPTSFVQLAKVDFMYLTGNKLSGPIPGWILSPIPGWILSRNKNVDISYNNFTWESSSPLECPRGSVNLVESYSASADNKLSTVHPCLKRNFPCSAMSNQHYSLHINCGGKELVVNDTKYEADLEQRGASMFYSGQNWAFSSTGNFMDNDIDADVYIDTNISALHNVTSPDSELYTTARVSPLSLTYYGLCLTNGNYSVKLHFAEIIYTNDKSFNSLGKRIFDVYIQGKLVLKDFNIEDDAGGAGKPILKNFTAEVTSNTLKIHFYWAGKGTTGIPVRGVYGPLISAISVDPSYPPKKSSRGTIILGSSLGAFFGVCLLVGSCILFFKRKGEGEEDDEFSVDKVSGMPTRFSYNELKTATNDFSNKLGEGGFGSVFQGTLSDGTEVAVKRLDGLSQIKKSFLAEVETIGSIHHVNLVRLTGFCSKKSHKLLVYEYMPNGSLDKWIFRQQATLGWKSRKKIILDVAKGLAYLHEECRQKIYHLDIKPQNILLDDYFNAKISDFGLAKLIDKDRSQVVTTMRGTVGYLAPEWLSSIITEKVDVYSFGVVLLEILCGRKNLEWSQPEEDKHLLSLFKRKAEEGLLSDLVDKQNDEMQLHGAEVVEMMRVALWCLQGDFTRRPSMSVVVKVLEGYMVVENNLDYSFTSPAVPRTIAAAASHLEDGVCSSAPLPPSTLSGPR